MELLTGLVFASCGIAIVWCFIRCLPSLNQPALHYLTEKRQNLPTSTYYLPFSLEEDKSISDQPGVHYKFSCDTSCNVLCIWAAPIMPLFEIFSNSCWQEIEKKLLEPAFRTQCFSSDLLLSLKGREEKDLKLTVPKQMKLGRAPRNCYPLVLVMVMEENIDILQHQAVAMMTAIHFKDETLNLETQILAQYLKLLNDKITLIQKLYPSDQGNKSYLVCSVCYAEPVQAVIMPCRHACLCHSCFQKCNICPMCRGPLSHFFSLND